MNFNPEHLTDTHPTLDHLIDATHHDPEATQNTQQAHPPTSATSDFDAFLAHAIATTPAAGRTRIPWLDLTLVMISLGGAAWYAIALYNRLHN
jgi:hypothetical protein